MNSFSVISVAAAFAALAISGPTYADEKPDPVEFCGTLGEVAEAIMTIRQTGVAMSKAMSIAGQNAELKDVVTRLIIAAYDTPQYSAEANRQDAAARFRNDFEAECFKGLME